MRRITFNVTTNVAASTVDIGIFSMAGTKLVSTGAVSTATTGAKQTTVSEVVLQPGPYIMAFTSTHTTVATDIIAPVQASYNAGSVKKCGTATGVVSAGALPASIGAISASSCATPLTIIEP